MAYVCGKSLDKEEYFPSPFSNFLENNDGDLVIRSHKYKKFDNLEDCKKWTKYYRDHFFCYCVFNLCSFRRSIYLVSFKKTFYGSIEVLNKNNLMKIVKTFFLSILFLILLLPASCSTWWSVNEVLGKNTYVNPAYKDLLFIPPMTRLVIILIGVKKIIMEEEN